MKAIRVHQFGGPEQLKLENISDVHPGPGQVVVKIHAIGVNPFDTYIRSGAYAIKPQLPYTPGADAAGVIASVGSDVKGVNVGQRVYVAGTVSGAYAEQALCQQAQVHPLAKNLAFQQGAGVGVPYATAYRALFHKAEVKPGESVLVHGASGGTGIAAVQLARARGAVVIGTAGTDEGRKLVLKEGAHYALDHHAADLPEQLAKLTEGKGVDVIVEMLANKNLGKDLTLLAKLGRVVVVGSRGSVDLNPREAMVRDAKILGMTILNAPPEEIAGIHSALVAGLENGTLRPVIGQELPLMEAAHAHEEVMKPSGAHGKIVLIP